jgi:hypothetical protein
MKLRNGFVSNSSSSSYIITNRSEVDKTLRDFVEATVDGVLGDYNSRGCHQYTRKEVMDSFRKYVDKIANLPSYYEGDGLSTSIDLPANSSRVFLFADYGDGGLLFEEIYRFASGHTSCQTPTEWGWEYGDTY